MPQSRATLHDRAHPATGNVTQISAVSKIFSFAFLFPFTQSFTQNQYCCLSAKQQQHVSVLMAHS